MAPPEPADQSEAAPVSLLPGAWATAMLGTDQLEVDTDAWTALLDQEAFALRLTPQGEVETRRRPLTPAGDQSLRTFQPTVVQDDGKSAISWPLVYQNFEILFEGQAASEREWLEEDRQILQQTLEQLALALHDAYMFANTQQAYAEVERLYQATSRLLEGTEFAQALEVLGEYTILREARSLYLYAPQLRTPEAGAQATHVRVRRRAHWPEHVSEGLPAEVQVTVQALPRRMIWGMPPDAEQLPPPLRTALQNAPVGALAVIPLLAGADLVGVLVALFEHEAPTLSPREQRVLATVVRQTASYVRSLSLQEGLRFTLELTNRLYRSALNLNQAADFQDILEVLLAHTPLGQGATTAGFFLFDPPLTEQESPRWGVHMASMAFGRPHQPEFPRIPFVPTFEMALLSEGPFLLEDREAEEAFRTTLLAGQPYIVEDVDADTVIAKVILREYKKRYQARSAIIVPLRVTDAVIGMVFAVYPHARLWDGEELQEIMVAAAQAAVRARSLHLLQVSERRARQLETASVIARDIGRTLSLETLLTRAVQLIRERFGFYHATVFLLDERGEYAEARAATGEAGRVMLRSGHKLRVGSRSVVGQTVARGEPVVVNDVRVNPIHRPNPLLPDTLAEAGFPLRVGDRVIGVLDVQATRTYAFTPEDVQVLQLLADQLAVAVENARAYELARRALQDMRRADELKSQFLASMSHELRTPLNSIIGFSRIILKGIDGPITDLQRQDLEAIFNAGQHLLSLINDILDLSKIEAGKMELTFTEVDVAEMVQDVLTTTQALVKDKPVQLEADIEPDLPPLRVDAKRFRQILLNLLSNAAKFTKEGHIRVRAYREVDPLTAYTEVVLAVEDTGPGIAPEHVERLFQPFYQVDNSLTREVGGTGLGLAITRNLVELHGGRIWVESEIGRGSTFYVAFPVTAGETGQAEDFLLVYDPDEAALQVLRRHFAVRGYRVVQVQHLSELIARAQSLRPLAVFVNPFLPRQLGIEALLELKKREETRYIPTYFLAVDATSGRVFSPRAHVLLTKPLQREDIVYLQTLLGLPNARWALVDRHAQHLQHIVELLEDLGVTDIVADTSGRIPDLPSDQPVIFVWDLLAPMPDLGFLQMLQQQVLGETQRLVVAMVDAQVDAETGAALEERLHVLQKTCTYPLSEALRYLEGVLYHLAARRTAGDGAA